MPDVDEGPVCPSCQQMIPLDRFDLNLEGLDGARPECPRTDLVEVAQRAREEARQYEERRRWTVFAHPFSRVGF